MEYLWLKFKNETKDDLSKIRSFLDEISHHEKSQKTIAKPKKTVKTTRKAKPKAMTPRKKIYGKLKDIVNQIMEAENLSRAQAYRVAKKRIAENL
ncbi:MAG: hypothetical protein JW700_02025 [Candidatus Aenigmarchaeota archaeon]|nr:hypothetical protein [Candidatus Aenigmarchaeota archaeon]